MKIRKAAILGLTAVLLSFPAAAQDAKPDGVPKVGERIGDWVFQCQAVSATRNICGLVQKIIDNKTKRQVVGIAIRYAGKETDRRLGMFVTVPLGIFLGSGIGGKIDDGKQFTFNLQTCNQRGCQGAVEIKPEMLAEMKKGNRLIVGFKARADSNTIAVPVSLKGFTQGLKTIDAN
tara:strand:- start:4943 stop:5470 length:528 start_codon:yes stop_codon:yes gene_type:complete